MFLPHRLQDQGSSLHYKHALVEERERLKAWKYRDKDAADDDKASDCEGQELLIIEAFQLAESSPSFDAELNHADDETDESHHDHDVWSD